MSQTTMITLTRMYNNDTYRRNNDTRIKYLNKKNISRRRYLLGDEAENDEGILTKIEA